MTFFYTRDLFKNLDLNCINPSFSFLVHMFCTNLVLFEVFLTEIDVNVFLFLLLPFTDIFCTIKN